MTTILFDTLDFANQLKDVGFTDEQARVMTQLQRAARDNTLEQARHDYHLDDVSTKRDLKEMEVALTRDMKEIEAVLIRDMKEMEVKLTRDMKEMEAKLTRDMKEMETRLTHDMKEMETRLTHDMKELDHKIELLRADTGRMMAETKAELIRWVVGVGLLQTSLIIGALMKMAHLI